MLGSCLILLGVICYCVTHIYQMYYTKKISKVIKNLNEIQKRYGEEYPVFFPGYAAAMAVTALTILLGIGFIIEDIWYLLQR